MSEAQLQDVEQCDLVGDDLTFPDGTEIEVPASGESVTLTLEFDASSELESVENWVVLTRRAY